MMQSDNKILKCSTVHISENSISEIDGKKAVLSIPREQIFNSELRHGIYSERPIVQTLISLFFIIPGFLFFLPLIQSLLYGRFERIIEYNLEPLTYGVPLFSFGLYLFLDVLRKRYYIMVKTDKKSRKIVFKNTVELPEILNFIKHAQRKFGYNIESKLN